MNMYEFIDAVMHGETSEQYAKRMARIRRLANERDGLEDGIETLRGDIEPRRVEKRQKMEKRLAKVLAELERLTA